MRRRAWIGLLALVAVVGVFPVVADRDSFPLSTYPMFSTRRTTTEPVTTAVGVDADGTIVRLSPTLIAGTDEVVSASVTVSRAIGSGRSSALCADIARRLVGSGRELSFVEVVTETFDSVRWFEGDHRPVARVVHARCPLSP